MTIRESIGMPTLKNVLGVTSITNLTAKQKKAVYNIKWCANDQWQFVNSWYDERCAESRELMLDANTLFAMIYDDSIKFVYREGGCWFSKGAESYLKDVRFCGKKFLETVCLYYTAKLMEDAIPEVDGTDDDVTRAIHDLTAIKNRIGI